MDERAEVMRRKLGRDLQKSKVQLEAAKRKLNMMSSAIRTSAHTKRRVREEDDENIKRLQQNIGARSQ